MELIKSTVLFIYETLKKLYLIVPAILFVTLDFITRIFGVACVIPGWLQWFLFISFIVIAMVLTYHELRMQMVDQGANSEQKIQNLKQRINDLDKTNNKDKLKAIIEMKKVCNYIPSDLNEQELIQELTNDSNFCKDLSTLLVRLFGLRDELIIDINPNIIDFIDTQLQPLYEIQKGRYPFKKEKTEDFAIRIFQFREIIKSEEKALIKKNNIKTNR